MDAAAHDRKSGIRGIEDPPVLKHNVIMNKIVCQEKENDNEEDLQQAWRRDRKPNPQQEELLLQDKTDSGMDLGVTIALMVGGSLAVVLAIKGML